MSAFCLNVWGLTNKKILSESKLRVLALRTYCLWVRMVDIPEAELSQDIEEPTKISEIATICRQVLPVLETSIL